MQYWVNGISMYIASYQSRNIVYWRGRWTDRHGKRHFLHFGKEDPRWKYIPIPEHPYQRYKPKPSSPCSQPEDRFYMQIDGHKALVRAEYGYCSNTRCTCRRIRRKHGPYYKAYYWDKEAKKQICISLGNVAPDGFHEHLS